MLSIIDIIEWLHRAFCTIIEWLRRASCTLEAKFTLQAALSLFCDFGIFSQERTINFAFRE